MSARRRELPTLRPPGRAFFAACLWLVSATAATAATAAADTVPAAERKAIFDAARPIAERMAGQPVSFKVQTLNVDPQWALFYGGLVAPGGGELEWEKATDCDPQLDKSMLVVLKRVAQRWQVRHIEICASEPPYWYPADLNRVGFPCDLYRGLDAGSESPPEKECVDAWRATQRREKKK